MKNNLTKNPNANEELITAMGKKLHDRTHFRSVISLHDMAVNNGADRATSHAKRAIALCLGIHTGELDSSEIKNCLSDIDIALKINKDLPVVQIAEGCYYYYCLKDFNKAIASFKKASLTDPKNYKALFYLAMVYKAQGNWHELKLLLKRIDKLDITNPLGLTNIGLCYEYLHDFDAAIKYHQKAIDGNPGWEAAYLNLFRTLLLKNSKTTKARSVLEKLIKITKEEHIEYQITLDLYEGNYSDAFDKAIKALNCDFNFIGVRSLYLGNISTLLKKKADKYFDCALKELNLELNANPNNAEIHSLIGLALAGKGNKVAAVTEGERAVSIAATDNNKLLESEMNINLGEIYARLGMFEEAVDKIKDSLKNHSLFSIKSLQHEPVWKPLLATPEIVKIIEKDNID